MSFFKLSSFQSRLSASFIVIVLTIFLVVVVGFYLNGAIKKGEKAVSETIALVTILEQVHVGLQKSDKLLIKYFYTHDQNEVNRIASIWQTDIHPRSNELENISVGLDNEVLRLDFELVFSELKKIQRIQSSLLKEKSHGAVNLYKYPQVSGDTIVISSDFEAWLKQNTAQLPLQYKRVLSPLTEASSNDIVILQSQFREKNNELLDELNKKREILKWLVAVMVTVFFLLIVGMWQLLSKHFKKSTQLLEKQLVILSRGNIPDKLNYPDDELKPAQHAIERLSENLKEIKHFFQEVSIGNINNDIQIFESKGDLGAALDQTKNQLGKIAEEDKRRNWTNKGLAIFADVLRIHSEDLDKLTDELVSNLVKYLNANQGGIFLRHETPAGQDVMKMEGAYAYNRKKFLQKVVERGQGLVGQCWQERESIYMTKVPEDYVYVTSGLGTSTPSCIFVAPLKIKEEVFGVIELASFNEFSELERNFMETLSETIATSIFNAQTNESTRRLLEESQQMTEEMQAQEEEMRQNMEELQATQEDIQRKNEENKIVQAELEKEKYLFNALLENLPESIYFKDIEGRFIRNSLAHIKSFGLDNQEELVGKTNADFLAPEFVKIFDEQEKEIMRTNTPILNQEHKDVFENGDVSWTLTTKMPLKNVNEETVGVFGVSHNISNQKVAELELNEQKANLNALINSTEDSVILIDKNYKVLILNDVIRKRYKGTQFEGIDIGADALEMLGNVRDEWKGYYDRALLGERLEFVIKSSVKGEKTFREYFINAIQDGDEITGISVFSRDVTEENLAKIEVKEKTLYLDIIEKISTGFIPLKTTDEVLQFTIDTICSELSIPVAHVFLKKKEELVSSGIWNTGISKEYKPFIEDTKEKIFKIGEGLPGRTWYQKAPNLINVISEEKEFHRKKSSLETGLHGAYCVPILFEEEILGVIEFFIDSAEQPKEQVLQTMMNIGRLVGRSFNYADLKNKLKRGYNKSMSTIDETKIKTEMQKINSLLRKT